MAYFDFYFNDTDIENLFNFIQLKGGEFIPDVFFETDNYKVIADYEDFFKYQKTETTHFFLVAKNYTIEPLSITTNEYLKEPKYIINQRYGGPYIDFSFYWGYADDAKIPYKRSNIDMYARFVHHDGYEEFKASDELRKYYNQLVSYIKKQCVKINRNNKGYWVSKTVWTEIEHCLE